VICVEAIFDTDSFLFRSIGLLFQDAIQHIKVVQTAIMNLVLSQPCGTADRPTWAARAARD